jgi:aerobic-type carbon monoxide dehydrogenase small subunit (CoxS/CutS family)
MPPAPAVAARLSADPLIRLRVDGADVEVPDDELSLLDVLRERLQLRTPKDGCSPQGQCGCCTVWVDCAPRVSCVTPIRRLAGREVTTVDGLPAELRQRWADAFTEVGASQCGFCTPGIIMRLAALDGPGHDGTRVVPEAKVHQALLAHLCRCTGWQTVVEAAQLAFEGSGGVDTPPRDLVAAARRAAIEGRSPQRVGPEVALGAGSFADDTAPVDAAVALTDGSGGFVVADTVADARSKSHKVQGRRTTIELSHPVMVPPGSWMLSLQTTWVEPAYVEPDASWCIPGGEPASPCANGGAFGGKRHSPLPEVARGLATEHQRPVRALWSREDVVRLGPKRPPVAAGMAPDGSGILRVGVSGDGSDAWWEQLVRAVARVAPGLSVEPFPVVGPPVSGDPRGAGWAEAAVLAACASIVGSSGPGPHRDLPVEVVAPDGARAVATYGSDDAITVSVAAGEVLDDVTLRSYCIGAVHQALGWVRSEGIAVDGEGAVHDLTIRSFGIIPARSVPPVTVTIDRDGDGEPVNGSDAVFAAAAAVCWLADGLAPTWPTQRTAGAR